MNLEALPRVQRLHLAAAEMAAAESAADPKARRLGAQRALLLEPMLALSRRWADALAPLQAPLPATARTEGPRRFLAIACEPFAADRGGGARYVHDVLGAMLDLGHQLDVYAVPGADAIDARALAPLQARGGGRIQSASADSPARADALLCLPGWRGARLAMLSGMLDLLTVMAGRRLPAYWLASDHVPSSLGAYVDPHERRALAEATARLAARSAAVAVVSAHEQARFVAQFGEAAPVRVVSPPLHGPAADATRPFDARADLAFVGSAHASNAEGLHWFLDAVWPAVRTAWPQAHLHLLGCGVEQLLRADDRGDTALRVVGAVPDLVAALARHRVSIAPMRQGGGIRIKVLDSFAAGTPVVATPLGAAGIDWCAPLPVPTEDAATFAAAVAAIGQEPSLWQPAHERLLAAAADADRAARLRAAVQAWLDMR